jgi:signal transduction histidine kinase
MIEDREGNIWCGTHAGLDRFRDSAFTSVPIPASDIPRFILATRDGSLWAFSASGGGIVRIAPGGQQELVDRIPIWAASEDENGVLWAVCVRPVFTLLLHLQEGRFVGVPLPGVNVLGGMDAMTTDPTRSTWLLEEAKGLFRLADGKLTNIRSRKDQVRSGGALLTDHLGRVWMADESRVLLSSQGVVQEFGPNEGVPLGPVFALHEDGAGNIWMGGESGLSKFDGSRFRALLDGDTLPLRSVSGIAEDQDGSWWVVADTGVIRIPAAELDHAFGDPSYRFRSQRFDTLDGLPAKARQAHRGPGAARTSDGRIWVATTSGLAFVDPRRLLKNDVPPPLQVEAVKIGGRQTAPADNVVYPHGTNDIEIDYTALSLSIPERVFFKYKLEGADADWHDAGTRRQAFYNHLGPKSYRFRVIACNSDGVWNEAGASWSFSVAPAFYQTIWFALASVLAGSLLLTGIYRLRVRQITAAMNARFDERLAERTRIARDLHDTLLQSIEGSRIVADDALKQRTDPGRLERALERLSGWLAQASEEGRSALSSLRSSAEEGNDLGQAFQRAGDECMLQRPIEFSVSIEGTAEEMHPIVRDEVYRIGYESIRNAFFHSGGSRLTVELNYRDGLSLRVRDNGKGMDPNLAAAGKGGHFGMLGMYERAARIKGKLTISSSPANGTQVELVVARSIAFHRPDPVRRSLSHKLTRLFKKGDRDEFL